MRAVLFFLGVCLSCPVYAGPPQNIFGLLEAGQIQKVKKLIPSLTNGDKTLETYLNAQVAFHQQDYAQANRILKTVKPDGAFEKKYRSFEDLVNETNERTNGFRTVKTKHFLLRYAPGKDSLLPLYAG